jgi:hypothetical protein
MRNTEALLESSGSFYTTYDPTDLHNKEREELLETGEIPHRNHPHSMTEIGRDT